MSMPKEPELVMKLRGGSVLGKKTILKSDHFPGCQNKRFSPQIDGAPNYRQADSLRVHGVAIPTIDGIRNVLKHPGAQINGKGVRVLWISLREEPVIYINGPPFVLRDEEKPLSNLELTECYAVKIHHFQLGALPLLHDQMITMYAGFAIVLLALSLLSLLHMPREAMATNGN